VGRDRRHTVVVVWSVCRARARARASRLSHKLGINKTTIAVTLTYEVPSSSLRQAKSVVYVRRGAGHTAWGDG